MHIFHMVACEQGVALFYAGDWQYAVWRQDWPAATGLHINYKEVLAAVSVARFGSPGGRAVLRMLILTELLLKRFLTKAGLDAPLSILRSVNYFASANITSLLSVPCIFLDLSITCLTVSLAWISQDNY